MIIKNIETHGGITGKTGSNVMQMIVKLVINKKKRI